MKELTTHTKNVLTDWLSIAENRITDIEYHAERIAGWDEDSGKERGDLRNLIKAINEVLGEGCK